MTALNFDFDSPRYQRLVSKAQALSSEQRGLLSTLLEAGTPDIASMEMKNYITLADLANKRDQAERTIELGKSKLTALYGPEGIYTKEIVAREGIAAKGLASKEKMAMAKINQDAEIGMKAIEPEGAIKGRILDFKEGQILPSAIIGGAGVAVSGLTGYARMRRDSESARRLDELAAQTRGIGAIR